MSVSRKMIRAAKLMLEGSGQIGKAAAVGGVGLLAKLVAAKSRPRYLANGLASTRRRADGLERRANAPVAFGNVQRQTGAVISTGDGWCRIRHRELVDTIPSLSTAFHCTYFRMQPGVQHFPWLNAIAARFESYRFNSLRYDLVSMVGTDEHGTMFLAPDYDPEDEMPTTLGQAMTFEGAVAGNVWQSLSCQCSHAGLNKRSTYFVSTLWNSTEDWRLIDAGALNVGFDGVAAQTVGQLWVDYDITFMTPQLLGASTPPLNQLKASGAAAATEVLNTFTVSDTTLSVYSGTIGFRAAMRLWSRPASNMLLDVYLAEAGRTLTVDTYATGAWVNVPALYAVPGAAGAGSSLTVMLTPDQLCGAISVRNAAGTTTPGTSYGFRLMPWTFA